MSRHTGCLTVLFQSLPGASELRGIDEITFARRQILNLAEGGYHAITEFKLGVEKVCFRCELFVSRELVQKTDKSCRIVAGLPRVLDSELIRFLLKLFLAGNQRAVHKHADPGCPGIDAIVRGHTGYSSRGETSGDL